MIIYMYLKKTLCWEAVSLPLPLLLGGSVSSSAGRVGNPRLIVKHYIRHQPFPVQCDVLSLKKSRMKILMLNRMKKTRT